MALIVSEILVCRKTEESMLLSVDLCASTEEILLIVILFTYYLNAVVHFMVRACALTELGRRYQDLLTEKHDSSF